MIRSFGSSRHTIGAFSLLMVTANCTGATILEPAAQEYLGIGIVSGTLGEQQRVAHFSREPASIQRPAAQEYLGRGIVSGTLGEQQRLAQLTRDSLSISVIGHVQAVEGAAYLIRDAQGREIRIPYDQNTMIDRPAHVGDRIQSWLDHRGCALLIRNLDGGQ